MSGMLLWSIPGIRDGAEVEGAVEGGWPGLSCIPGILL
jgi:hypothetical protein